MANKEEGHFPHQFSPCRRAGDYHQLRY